MIRFVDVFALHGVRQNVSSERLPLLYGSMVQKDGEPLMIEFSVGNE
jgi:hypothetical protein